MEGQLQHTDADEGERELNGEKIVCDSSTSWELEVERRKEKGDDLKQLVGMVKDKDGEHQEWVVERVIGKKGRGRKVQYRVRWAGFDSKYDSWEPISHLKNAKELVREFQARKKNSQKTKAKVSKEPVDKEDGVDVSGPSDGQGVVGGDAIASVVEDATRKMGQLSLAATDDPMDNTDLDLSSVSFLNEKEEEGEVTEDAEDGKFELRAQAYHYGPHFRRLWRKHEVPLKIIGTDMLRGEILHLVRLKPESELEARKILEQEDPWEGATDKNCVVVCSSSFRQKYPQMLIEYYEANFQLVDTEEELVATRNAEKMTGRAQKFNV